MNFESYLYLRGQHATFSPSNYHWINYSLDKIADISHSQYRKTLGTEIHEVAAAEIALRHKQTSIKHVREAVETHIFKKYCNNPNSNDSEQNYGKDLLEELRYLQRDVFENVRQYVNDAIGFKMDSEVVLVYDPHYFFGTTDAISFRDGLLRIHDLKTGATPAHMEQLEIYMSLFCLQYNIKPRDIESELRIYQNNEILYLNPTVDDIVPIMDKIVTVNNYIKQLSEDNQQ